jgi:hypothetical protein
MDAIFVDGVGAGSAPSGIFSQLQVARPPSRAMSFSTADGGTVVADLYAASSSDGVALTHGAAFYKVSWAPLGQDRAPGDAAVNYRPGRA